MAKGVAVVTTTCCWGFCAGGVPELPVTVKEVSAESLALIKQMAALNKRVGLLEMTNHEFLDANRRKERSTFADGTTVMVDWDADTVKIEPELSAAELNLTGMK
jgi:hypothetical protein